jgi:hypothetical protein
MSAVSCRDTRQAKRVRLMKVRFAGEWVGKVEVQVVGGLGWGGRNNLRIRDFLF